MAMQRKNPLPPGRYWIFIQKQSLDIFELWLKKNADVVTVEKREDSGGMRPFLNPNESYFIFNVKEASIWPRGVGFPNIADAETKQASDVVQRPPPPTVADVVKDIEKTAAEAASDMMIAAIIVGLILLWEK
jgi:hypothetical protein